MSLLPTTWQDALAHRQRHFDLQDPDMCVRLLHGEDPSLRCDRFGSVCWFYEYATGQPAAARQLLYESFTRAAGARHWHVHAMRDRGRHPQPGQHTESADAPRSWRATENQQLFELRAGTGQSPGLFLDQRDNRAWVRQHTQGARILNLFAYTGGFGLAALAGGALEVVQVDVSPPYLDWARVNAALNGLDSDRVQYSAVDARLLVAGCRRKGRRFDGIICDPPSFGRGRGSNRRVFRVEQDLEELVRECREILEPGGWVLVSCNFEGWTQARFESVVRGIGGTIESAPGAGQDCQAAGVPPLLKSCVLRPA
ncbi:MAG: class I SAM-dependent methyltransferase [bacterium]|nr:class I SAM-dependent methyltransferase [bacterium]